MKKRVITRKAYQKYQTIIHEKEISKISESGEVQESCVKWVDELENTMKQVEKMETKSPRLKIQPKRKKQLTMELKTTKNNLENRMPLKRVIRDKITDKIKEDRATKITRDIESINNNVDNGNEI